MRIEASNRGGIAPNLYQSRKWPPGPGPGSGGSGEEQSRLELGVPSAIRRATWRFGPPTARGAAGTTSVRISVRLRFLKSVELTVAGQDGGTEVGVFIDQIVEAQRKWVQYTSTESRSKVVMSAVCASVADNANLISNATYSYKFHFRHRTGNPLDYCPCPYSCACWFHASMSKMHVLRGNVVRYLRAG